MRRVLAAAALALLAVSAGCTAFGSSGVDRDKLTENVSYDWNTTADVTIAVARDRYHVVYRFENRSTVEIYGFRRFNNERPMDPIGARFRYPNGTVVTLGEDAVRKTRSRTVVTVPASEGAFAYSAPKRGKRVRVPTLADGSYEVILPPDARVKYPLLGRVIPRGYEPAMEDERVHLRWDEVRNDRIVVRYYLARDLLLFGGLVAVAVALFAVGIVYFWLQLRALKERREEVALGGDDGRL